jgi:hypothetical protein
MDPRRVEAPITATDLGRKIASSVCTGRDFASGDSSE